MNPPYDIKLIFLDHKRQIEEDAFLASEFMRSLDKKPVIEHEFDPTEWTFDDFNPDY